MALREFRDGRGVEWLAWDVPPVREFSPERTGRERRVAQIAGFTPERRVLRDRRRTRAASGLERGWLCFQCEGEKRRLAPPPPDWAAVDEKALAELLLAAQPTRPAR
jgi:hypothetical protein